MVDNKHTIRQTDQGYIQRFSDNILLERGLSRNTINAYCTDIRLFSKWLLPADIALVDVSRVDIMNFLSSRLTDGASVRSSARTLSSLRSFYGFLRREKEISVDPTALVESPRIGRPLPKTLSETEVEQLLAAPDPKTDLGCRDRTMLELLYACGLRVSELITLELDQINLSRGVVRVWGKGSKERMIPVGDSAVKWVERYIKGARINILEQTRKSSNVLFLSRRGQTMTRQTFWHLIKRHARAAEIKVELSPHTVRHAFATHLVNHDADLRVVQLLLGHSDLSTTQIYTHVALERMKDLHAVHHPRG